jgi:hypothetical protein
VKSFRVQPGATRRSVVRDQKEKIRMEPSNNTGMTRLRFQEVELVLSPLRIRTVLYIFFRF